MNHKMMLFDQFYLLQTTATVIRPFYSVCAITFVIGSIGIVGKTFRQGWKHLQQLHQVPCSRCAYFTGDYRLKCTVHPAQALTEEAIDCRDFEASLSNPTHCCSKPFKS
jgi:hypothetical protein